jgi:hypothetical protein
LEKPIPSPEIVHVFAMIPSHTYVFSKRFGDIAPGQGNAKLPRRSIRTSLSQVDQLQFADIDDLLADVLEGKFEPGRVFVDPDLDDVPDGYRAKNERGAIRYHKALDCGCRL